MRPWGEYELARDFGAQRRELRKPRGRAALRSRTIAGTRDVSEGEGIPRARALRVLRL